MQKVVLFGILDTAQLAHYYLKKDPAIEVVGFTVHEEHVPESKFFEGLPVVPFESVTSYFPPSDYKLFAPLTGRKMNRLRESIYLEGKAKGYDFISYVSPNATVNDNQIGENCFILEDNTLQPFTKIGNNVVLWSGNHIGHHGEIKDHVFFTSHVVLSGHCLVNSYSWFGVNSTITNDCTIAEGTCVAMGALISKNTDAWQLYAGSPARAIKSSQELDF
ncbi:MAG: sugar O-acyltransferase [Herbaspirillum sp.]|jgi:sugar O-acyltransferase (sialic acid O-acetyltransferase NeuD family)|nr:sugar O-acyltransferase [Herbaspirillum sp.]